MSKRNWISAVVMMVAAVTMSAQERGKEELGYQDTPLLPGARWHVHDGRRPQPKVVTPAPSVVSEGSVAAPSDAMVLFDGTSLSKWRSAAGQPSGWRVANGYMEVPSRGTPNGGDIWTRDEFGDCQLHIEWSTPKPPHGDSQGRGNSGVFFFGRYEFQVLDSYQNPTYPDGQAGALYGQFPPLVNASRPPGEWQVYDLIFTAPHFRDGQVDVPAYVTAFHNGVVVHNHTAYLGTTGHRTLGKYTPHPARGPMKLQDHGDPVRYRNIWIRPLGSYDES